MSSPLSLRSAPLARAYAALRHLEELKADEIRNPLPSEGMPYRHPSVEGRSQSPSNYYQGRAIAFDGPTIAAPLFQGSASPPKQYEEPSRPDVEDFGVQVYLADGSVDVPSSEQRKAIPATRPMPSNVHQVRPNLHKHTASSSQKQLIPKKQLARTPPSTPTVLSNTAAFGIKDSQYIAEGDTSRDPSPNRNGFVATPKPYTSGSGKGFTFSRASSPTGTGPQMSADVQWGNSSTDHSLLERMLKEMVHLRRDTQRAIGEVAKLSHEGPHHDSVRSPRMMASRSSSTSVVLHVEPFDIIKKRPSSSHIANHRAEVETPTVRTAPMGHRDPWVGSRPSLIGTPTQSSRARRDQTLQQRAEFAAAQERALLEEEEARKLRMRATRKRQQHIQTDDLLDGEEYTIGGAARSHSTSSAPRSNHAADLRHTHSAERTRSVEVAAPTRPAPTYTQRILEMSSVVLEKRRSASAATNQSHDTKEEHDRYSIGTRKTAATAMSGTTTPGRSRVKVESQHNTSEAQSREWKPLQNRHSLQHLPHPQAVDQHKDKHAAAGGQLSAYDEPMATLPPHSAISGSVSKISPQSPPRAIKVLRSGSQASDNSPPNRAQQLPPPPPPQPMQQPMQRVDPKLSFSNSTPAAPHAEIPRQSTSIISAIANTSVSQLPPLPPTSHVSLSGTATPTRLPAPSKVAPATPEGISIIARDATEVGAISPLTESVAASLSPQRPAREASERIMLPPLTDDNDKEISNKEIAVKKPFAGLGAGPTVVSTPPRSDAPRTVEFIPSALPSKGPNVSGVRDELPVMSLPSQLPEYLAAMCHTAPPAWVATQLRAMLAHIASDDLALEGANWLVATAMANGPLVLEKLVVPMLLAELGELSQLRATDEGADGQQQQLLCAIIGLGPLARSALRPLLDMLEGSYGDSKLVAMAVRSVGGIDGLEALCSIARGEGTAGSVADIALKARCVATYALGLMPAPIIARTSVCLLASDKLKGKMSFMRPAASDEPYSGLSIEKVNSAKDPTPMEEAATVSEDDLVRPRVPNYRVTHIFLDFEAFIQRLIPLVESPAFAATRSGREVNKSDIGSLRSVLLKTLNKDRSNSNISGISSSIGTYRYDMSTALRDFLTCAPAVHEKLLAMASTQTAAKLKITDSPLAHLDVTSLVSLLPSLALDARALAEGGYLVSIEGGDWAYWLASQHAELLPRMVPEALLASILEGGSEGLAQPLLTEQVFVTAAIVPPAIAYPIAKAFVGPLAQTLCDQYLASGEHHNALAAMLVAIGSLMRRALAFNANAAADPDYVKATQSAHALYSMALLKMDSWRLRQACCLGLGMAGDLGGLSGSGASQCVKALLASIHRGVIALPSAMWALTRLGRIGVAVLVDLATQRHVSTATRVAALKALGTMDVLGVSGGLKAEVGQVVEVVSQTLLGVIEEYQRSETGEPLATEAATSLGQLLSGYTAEGQPTKDYAEAASYFRDIAISPLVSMMAPLLESSPETILPGPMLAIMKAMATHGGPHAEVLVSQWLLQSDWVNVRVAAAEGLRCRGPAVIRVLASGLSDPSAVVRATALASLEAIGIGPTLQVLRGRPQEHSHQMLHSLQLITDGNTKLPANSGGATGKARYASELAAAIRSELVS